MEFTAENASWRHSGLSRARVDAALQRAHDFRIAEKGSTITDTVSEVRGRCGGPVARRALNGTVREIGRRLMLIELFEGKSGGRGWRVVTTCRL